MLLCVMEMFKNSCVPPPSWSAFGGPHWEKNGLMTMKGSAAVEGKSVLLQMLLLSESDSHLGKVSKHVTKVSTVPAQGQRGDQLWSIHPADSQGFYQPPSFIHAQIGQRKKGRTLREKRRQTNKWSGWWASLTGFSSPSHPATLPRRPCKRQKENHQPLRTAGSGGEEKKGTWLAVSRVVIGEQVVWAGWRDIWDGSYRKTEGLIQTKGRGTSGMFQNASSNRTKTLSWLSEACTR